MGLGLGAQSRLIRDGLAVDQPRLPTWNRLGVLRPTAVHGLSKLPVFLPGLWRARPDDRAGQLPPGWLLTTPAATIWAVTWAGGEVALVRRGAAAWRSFVWAASDPQ